jgi:hypothetical protein
VVASLVKTPEALLLLIGSGAALCLRTAARGGMRTADLLWLGPGLLYFILASMSGLQLGLRLVLPCLPFALLFAARAVDRLPKWAAGALVSLLLVSTAWQYPHLLSYFNFASGGPTHAIRYLSDSNVDWGQNLRELRRYVQQQNIPRIRLSYFGSDNVFAYFRNDQIEWINPPYGGSRPASRRLEPTPGVYAISATLLTGQFADPPYRDYYAAFRAKQPVAYAGHSIYIYRFP